MCGCGAKLSTEARHVDDKQRPGCLGMSTTHDTLESGTCPWHRGSNKLIHSLTPTHFAGCRARRCQRPTGLQKTAGTMRAKHTAGRMGLSFVSHVMPVRKSSSFCVLLQRKKQELMTWNPKRNKRPWNANTNRLFLQRNSSPIGNEDHGKRFWYPRVVLLADFLDRGDRDTE